VAEEKTHKKQDKIKNSSIQPGDPWQNSYEVGDMTKRVAFQLRFKQYIRAVQVLIAYIWGAQ